jgi:UDP-glucose 6-dehydrogenase
MIYVDLFMNKLILLQTHIKEAKQELIKTFADMILATRIAFYLIS